MFSKICIVGLLLIAIIGVSGIIMFIISGYVCKPAYEIDKVWCNITDTLSTNQSIYEIYGTIRNGTSIYCGSSVCGAERSISCDLVNNTYCNRLLSWNSRCNPSCINTTILYTGFIMYLASAVFLFFIIIGIRICPFPNSEREEEKRLL
jgi:hypothetical protein